VTEASTPALYAEHADWFHLLTAPEEYVEEADLVLRLLGRAVNGTLETLLELGAGGGNLASCLPATLRLTLTDVSEAMLLQSRRINPTAEHIVGDMRTLRLGRTFDAVLVHDAVMYMTSRADLQAAAETAFAHLRPGGAAVFVPDAVRETFRPETRHGGHDGDGRALRYLEWIYDPDPDDTSFVTDFAIMVREADGGVEVAHDRHLEGLFAREDWLALLRGAGFEPDRVVDAWGRELFVARRATGRDGVGRDGHG
jgi:SAM-dependent methyltransferase